MARDWAYDHQDADMWFGVDRPSAPLSAHTDHYIPLCRACHETLDNGQARGDALPGWILTKVLARRFAPVPG
jgi:hypothetical protein